MRPRALWLPHRVASLDATLLHDLGLTTVDSWRQGLVLSTPMPVFVELATDEQPDPAPLAFEVASAAEVDAAAARLGVSPHRYSRGHYGFEFASPGGLPLMIWSEKT
ncbi:hypothetical protein [Longispora albida]|uniref:hypothetical protein n=1 Tax=Longispora albida TaxID=203523 RepID=UPI0003720523|nr:hypothetical protein [Longispora albida]